MNLYEVAIRVKNRATGEVKVVTRREHAYSVMDAFMQATMNYGADVGGHLDGYELSLDHIGPPADLVAQFEAGLGRAIHERLGQVLKQKGTDDDDDKR